MKKALLILMAALLSMGTVMAQGHALKRLSHKLPAHSATAQVSSTLGHSANAPKDDYCQWFSNVASGEQAGLMLGGLYGAYGIQNYAELITNTLSLTIDSLAIVADVEDATGSCTLAIYSEANGLPGTSLGSVTLSSSNVNDGDVTMVALPNPVNVAGNYFIVFSTTDDDFFVYTTGFHTVGTAYVEYQGSWYNCGQMLQDQRGNPANVACFLYAHGCAGNLEDSTFTLTVVANDPTMGTVSGGGQYAGMATATLTATPNEGYRFKFWQDQVTDNPRTVQVMGNATYTAIFAPELHCTKTLPWSEGFEDEDELECWTLLDEDGDGYTWERFSGEGMDEYAHSGNSFITSASYDNNVGELTPNNWLISPEIVIPEGGAILSWWSAPLEEDWNEEHYAVKLSATAGLTPADFTETLFEETIDYTTWTAHSVAINQSGTVRIAFEHYNCTDQYLVMIDDIAVVANSGETYTVTAQVSPEGAGTVSGAGEYPAGFYATLTAEETNDDYYFVDWSTGETSMSISVQVTEDVTITANFAEKPDCHYTLPYSYGFEDANLNRFCWNIDVFDEDNGMGWALEHDEYAELAHSGSGMAFSSSTLMGFFPLDPTDWLISPEIEIPAGGANMEFYISNYGGENDACTIMLAPNGGNEEADFTETLRTVYTSGQQWEAFHVNIPTEGNVRIAFVHTNPNGTGAYLFLDDITITAGQSTEGVSEVDGQAEVLSVEYYDVLGRRLQQEPARGMYLVRTLTTQGSQTQKIIK